MDEVPPNPSSPSRLGPFHHWPALLAPNRRLVPARVSSHLAFYVLVPVGALLGFAEVGMGTSAHARMDPAWFKKMKSLGLPADPHRAAMRTHLKEWIGYYWLALVALVFFGAQIRNQWQRRSASPLLPWKLLRSGSYWSFGIRSQSQEWDDRMYRCAVVGDVAPHVASGSRELLGNFPRLTTLKLTP